MSLIDVAQLRQIAEIEFKDIVIEALITDVNALRIMIHDGSFVDVWFSLKLSNRYSYHWERRGLDGTIYRHDNMPDKKWQTVSSFPKHFHDGSEKNVSESQISEIPEQALREFLTFIRTKL